MLRATGTHIIAIGGLSGRGSEIALPATFLCILAKEREIVTPLAGKAALVTGGSRGIGAAIAEALGAAGADVAVTFARSHEGAEAVAARIRARERRAAAILADAADPAQVSMAVDRAAATFGRLDILVNNAGNFVTGMVGTLTLDDFEEAVSVNVRGVFAATRRAVDHLPAGGRIISIGSCHGTRAERSGISLYAMSKSALIGLTKGVARDLASRRITVNLIQPGSTDTDMNPAGGPHAAANLATLALPHFGHPRDVAAMVVHLAGEGGRFVTGAVIDVDGGFAA